jgi:hypothetical protein
LSHRRYESHFYGKDACGKYLYLGKYRRSPQDPDAEIQELSRTFEFLSLGEASKLTYVQQHVRKRYRIQWVDGSGEVKSKQHDDMTVEDFQEAQAVEAEKWDRMTDVQQKMAAWIVMAVKAGYRIEVVPI